MNNNIECLITKWGWRNTAIHSSLSQRSRYYFGPFLKTLRLRGLKSSAASYTAGKPFSWNLSPGSML